MQKNETNKSCMIQLFVTNKSLKKSCMITEITFFGSYPMKSLNSLLLNDKRLYPWHGHFGITKKLEWEGAESARTNTHEWPVNFFGRFVPCGVPKVGSKELIFFAKLGVLGMKI